LERIIRGCGDTTVLGNFATCAHYSTLKGGEIHHFQMKPIADCALIPKLEEFFFR
jgi:hypothetical protein